MLAARQAHMTQRAQTATKDTLMQWTVSTLVQQSLRSAERELSMARRQWRQQHEGQHKKQSAAAPVAAAASLGEGEARAASGSRMTAPKVRRAGPGRQRSQRRMGLSARTRPPPSGRGRAARRGLAALQGC